MKTLTSILTLLSIFFLATSSVLFLLQDISDKNPNLNNDSVEMLNNLKSWDSNANKYRFVENKANYSLTGYETIDPEDKDNAESKGAIEVFLFMGDTFVIIPQFIDHVLPGEFSFAVAFLTSFLVVILGYYFTIAIYNAWKARRT